MSKLDAKQVWRKNYEMSEFSYVRGQVKCTKQHAHVLLEKVVETSAIKQPRPQNNFKNIEERCAGDEVDI